MIAKIKACYELLAVRKGASRGEGEKKGKPLICSRLTCQFVYNKAHNLTFTTVGLGAHVHFKTITLLYKRHPIFTN